MNEKEGRSDEGGEGSASVTSRALAGSAVWDPALDLPPVNHQVLWAETTSLMLSPKHQFLENILRAGLPRNTEVEDREALAPEFRQKAQVGCELLDLLWAYLCGRRLQPSPLIRPRKIGMANFPRLPCTFVSLNSSQKIADKSSGEPL